MFWDTIQLVGCNLIFIYLNKLTVLVYIKILGFYEGKLHFQEPIVQQDDVLVNETKFFHIFFKEKERETFEWS